MLSTTFPDGWTRRAHALLLALLVLVGPRIADATTLIVPVGGHAVPMPAEVVLCHDTPLPTGWTLEADGRSIRPPSGDDPIGHTASIRVAPTLDGCATQGTNLDLVAVGPMPQIDSASVVVDVDAGRVTLRGHRLRGMVLRWRAGSQSGEDTCALPEATGAMDACAFAIGRGLPADPSQIQLLALPSGTRGPADATLFDALARRVDPSDLAVRVTSVVVARLFPPDTSVDVSSGLGRIALEHPEAVGSVECVDASCDLDGHDVVVRGEHGSDDNLDVHFHLRPHVVAQHGSTTDANPITVVSLQRCPVSIASASPLRGASDQRVVVRIGARCAHDAAFDLATTAGPAVIERNLTDGGDLYLVARVASIDAGELAIVVRRGGSIAGIARTHTVRPPAVHARLEIPGRGAVDFVPTNREAQVRVPSIGDAAVLVPDPVEGVYDIRRDASGVAYIRGVDGVAGSVALRFAYRDRSLPAPLRTLDLAEVDEPVDRPLRAANLPVPLVSDDTHQTVAEVLCGDGEGHATVVSPGATRNIPYRARNTCKLVLHRERLRPEDGAQAVRVTIGVTASDGTTRSDARLDRRLVLRPSDTPVEIALPGAVAAFDRLLVQIALSDEGDHYAIPADEHLGSPRAQWSIVMGTSHARIYATTAIPTGLFRLADAGHSGILSLNAGAILRAVLLTREGIESPVGLEAGVMWLGIAGDVDHAAATGGEVAVVAGLGISVPIANANRATQTSINLHAWFEYEVSHTVLGQAGSPYGLVFGPSISIGDVGTSF